ncbi:hypothetical protein, partial [Plasticicumulans sp.]|uniref:hypothetical protein n=1 Tax=Plasticicumulans sp. TaxID=2307179 RepID=UPI002CB116C3
MPAVPAAGAGAGRPALRLILRVRTIIHPLADDFYSFRIIWVMIQNLVRTGPEKLSGSLPELVPAAATAGVKGLLSLVFHPLAIFRTRHTAQRAGCAGN